MGINTKGVFEFESLCLPRYQEFESCSLYVKLPSSTFQKIQKLETDKNLYFKKMLFNLEGK